MDHVSEAAGIGWQEWLQPDKARHLSLGRNEGRIRGLEAPRWQRPGREPLTAGRGREGAQGTLARPLAAASGEQRRHDARAPLGSAWAWLSTQTRRAGARGLGCCDAVQSL